MDEAPYERDQAVYKRFIDSYLAKKTDVEGYIQTFMDRWKQDRDRESERPWLNPTPEASRFGRLTDRLFTSCDCYRPVPAGPIEISEETLRLELTLFRYIWWGL